MMVKGNSVAQTFLYLGTKPGDELTVFVYHDLKTGSLQQPSTLMQSWATSALDESCGLSPHGAFLDWGLMKRPAGAKSKQISPMHLGGEYLVYLYIDEQTGRVAALNTLNTCWVTMS